MVKQKAYTIIWDRIALDHFKSILEFLSKQSSLAPKIVKEGVLSRLNDVKKNALIFELDKLKDTPNKEFRAFVVYSYRVTYQIKSDTREIRVLRVRHTSREPLGYQFIFDNSESKHELLADKQIDGMLNVVNQKKFNLLKNYYDNN